MMNALTVTEFFSYLTECDASRALGAFYPMLTRDSVAANELLVGAGR